VEKRNKRRWSEGEEKGTGGPAFCLERGADSTPGGGQGGGEGGGAYSWWAVRRAELRSTNISAGRWNISATRVSG